MRAIILTLALLGQPTARGEGRIEVDQYDPIVVNADIEVPDGATLAAVWIVDKPAKYRETDNGHTVYIWAPPGKYEIRLVATLIDFEKKTFKKQSSVTTLMVRGPPDPKPPGPGPGPGPTPPGPQPPPDDLPADYDNAAKRAAEAVAGADPTLVPQWVAAIENAKNRMESRKPEDLSMASIYRDLYEAIPDGKLKTMLQADLPKYNRVAQWEYLGYVLKGLGGSDVASSSEGGGAKLRPLIVPADDAMYGGPVNFPSLASYVRTANQ